jgi:hypothetical protein
VCGLIKNCCFKKHYCIQEKHDVEMKKWEEHQETLPPEQRATREQRKIVDDQKWIKITGGK